MAELNNLITRRELLKATAAGVALLAGGGALSAATATAASAGSPKRGGTLRVGVTGGASSDTLDPNIWVTNPDGLRVFQLYDSLLAFDQNAQPQLSLAEEFTANADATEWTVRLRKGVTFHDGKPLTIEDVIFTFQRILNPKAPGLGADSMQPLDMKNAKKLDPLTVRIPCHTPFGEFRSLQALYDFFIVPVGFNPKRPVGTGPFKYESFEPGLQSTFVRNPNYWETGLPYVDTVVITELADETTQVNGLVSGQFDIIDALTADAVPAVQSGGGKLLVSEGGSYTPFTMRVDQAPFNDVRVREAMRLVVDRKEMRELVFGQYGQIGNDLFGLWDPGYDHSLPQREVDVEQARSLLKKAGHENLKVTLVTADIVGGAIKAAEVFAQQAAAAGVTVTLQQVPVTTFYGPNYLKWTFAQDFWIYVPYIRNAQQALLAGAEYNECHVADPTYAKLFKVLEGTTDPQKAIELTHELQTREYEGFSSGFIIPYFQPEIDAYTSRVHGLLTNKCGNPLGNYTLKTAWLA
jgi:peptide/nickel transport system substrate-binding protein